MSAFTVGRLASPSPVMRRAMPNAPASALVNPPQLAPSLHTDAYEDGQDWDSKMIFLGGGIAYWWGERFGSPEHQDYVQWRNDVRATLIEHGYLTFAPHEAFKGTWNRKAQIVNDAAIIASDLVLVISPRYAIGNGTREEVMFARRNGTPVAEAPPETGLMEMLKIVEVSVK